VQPTLCWRDRPGWETHCVTVNVAHKPPRIFASRWFAEINDLWRRPEWTLQSKSSRNYYRILKLLIPKSAAFIQLLKDKRITTTEELAQYARQADQASNVKERGLRVRMEYLFSNAAKRSA